MRAFLITAALCLAGTPALSADRLHSSFANWPKAELTMQNATSSRPANGIAGVYQSEYASLFLAPNGDAATTYQHSHDEDTVRSAMLGSYRRNGSWIEIAFDQPAMDLSSVSAEVLEEMRAWELEASKVDGDEPADDRELSILRLKLLPIPHAGGLLLVDANVLPHAVNSWDGNSELELRATYWNLPGDLAKTDDESEFLLQFPFDANLPLELTRMLRREPFEVRTLERLQDETTLTWERHYAEVRYVLEKGELHGVYEGMRLHSLPPHGGKFARVVEAGPDHAIAAISISRFHPDDQPELPPESLSFTTRTADGGSCGLDYSAAVRASVTAISTPVEELDFDEEGYAWLFIDIDQGAAQGLIVGDVLRLESRYDGGEGRVHSVNSSHATLLWRVQRYGSQHMPTPPTADDKLVTPSWQRYEYDLFGDVSAFRGLDPATDDGTDPEQSDND